ncbi:hypothetical protein QMZ92_09130 [Streptomyces sp. HNM0645]|uniref:hypothetical protein n=1 Tax=Streptomyces sp. HNM0645 TaxID=2782343 RepID=UPI0024B8065A|nr:hypothetical protein [Streptomyces sp. HNM0645]MDI9884558.1 hypothetical protein [Streptomyces sp. HNM0645]
MPPVTVAVAVAEAARDRPRARPAEPDEPARDGPASVASPGPGGFDGVVADGGAAEAR